MNAEAIEHRRQAITQTTPEISRLVLSFMPDLIAHPGPPLAPGAYYTDVDLNHAICATAEEAMLLHDAVRLHKPKLAIEIGSYVGWTAIHMALAMSEGKLVCIDSLTESSDAALQESRWHDNVTGAGVWDHTELQVGDSPGCLDWIVNPVDFAFIDGSHKGPQPLLDIRGMMTYMAPTGVIAVHDTWMPDVAVACAWLVEYGWGKTVFNTPGRLAMFYKTRPTWLDVLEGAA